MSVQQLLEGQYKLIQSIGNGGAGHTFIAKDINNPSLPQCVVRHFKPASTKPEFIDGVRQFFGKQVEKLERLGKHDQIPQLLSSFEKDNQFFIVQEFIEGQSLNDEIKATLPQHQSQHQHHLTADGHKLEEGNAKPENVDNLQRDKCFSETEVIKILLDVLNILEFVHAEGVIHYDIQPSNLIRRKKDQKIMLINLGALQEMQDNSAQLKVDEKGEPYFTITIGTPGYTPSEQCAGRPTYSSDIYALGMVAIKALTGYDPIDLSNNPETGELIWKDKAQVSSGLVKVLTRMVRYHYTQRYQSAREVIHDLGEATKEIEREKKAVATRMLSSKYPLDHLGDDNFPSRRNNSTVVKSNAIVMFSVLITVVAAISAFILPIVLRGKIADRMNLSEPVVQNSNTARTVSATVPSPESGKQSLPNPTAQSSGEAINKFLNLEPNQETVVSNKIQANGTHTYTFQARNGQLINTIVKGNNVSMSILDAKGTALIGATNVPSANITLPDDGAYIIELKGVGNGKAANYQLNVSLKDLSLPKVPTTSPSAPISPTNLASSPVPTTTASSSLPTTSPSVPASPTTAISSPVPTPTASSPVPTASPSEPQAPPIEIKVRNKK